MMIIILEYWSSDDRSRMIESDDRSRMIKSDDRVR